MDKERLLKELIDDGYLKTKQVIDAFSEVPRENFVPQEYRKHAYVNEPLPTAAGQTISQPLTVAVMTEALAARKGDRILEVGTGSGYQAALLSVIAGEKGRIITTEIIPELFEFAKKNLKNYRNVTLLNRDGSLGCDDEAPFDRIMVTAEAKYMPPPLLDQLKKNGRMVIPIDGRMFLIEKEDRIKNTSLGYFAFVPLRGKHGSIL